MVRYRLLFPIFFAILFSCRSYGSGPVVYAITDVNWEPYWIVSDQNISGILSDIMVELNHRIPHLLFASPPLPVKRSQHTFKTGGTIIECCINQAWRPPFDANGRTLWSDAVVQTKEILVFRKNHRFPVTTLDDLDGKTIATILGYGYVGEDKFIRSDTMDNLAQLSVLALGRADAAIIDYYEYQYMRKNSVTVQAIEDKLEEGPVINQTLLKMRIHSSRPDLVVPINTAIKEMKADGMIEKILDRYTND